MCLFSTKPEQGRIHSVRTDDQEDAGIGVEVKINGIFNSCFVEPIGQVGAENDKMNNTG